MRYHVIQRRDADPLQPGAALVYGYGGFNVSFIPNYLGILMPYVEAGGILVFAHLRGGGEFGEDFWLDGAAAPSSSTPTMTCTPWQLT